MDILNDSTLRGNIAHVAITVDREYAIVRTSPAVLGKVAAQCAEVRGATLRDAVRAFIELGARSGAWVLGEVEVLARDVEPPSDDVLVALEVSADGCRVHVPEKHDAATIDVYTALVRRFGFAAGREAVQTVIVPAAAVGAADVIERARRSS